MAHNLPPEIQQLLRRNSGRELTSREREVYKEKKKEIQKDSSRMTGEDDDWGEVSARPAFGQEAIASSPPAVDFVSSPLGSGTACQEESGNVISPRELTSRYSGITVQHVRTDRGVKVAITLQQPEWRTAGAVQMATAELKRYERMREIRATADDSAEFAQYLENTKTQLQESKNRSACMGRLHVRGRRSQWLLDTLIVAVFDDTVMSTVMLYLEGEEFLIEMNHPLSPNQEKYYHTAGIHGQIQSAQKAPRLSDLPLVKFGDTP